MLTTYTGIMGSGKSVLAVNRIYNNFSTDKDAKKEKNVTFKNCYTNIVEFKFDKVEHTKELDFDVLLKILTRLHELYKKKKNDNYLVRFCELVKMKDTFFVIDEAQNHFDVENKVLVWWITYHRHLYHEILMITPDLGLINLKYKKLNELVYVAKPRLLVLDKRFFVYNIYCNYKLTKASHTGKIKHKANPKVFELYKSGDSINGQNIVLKFVLISFAIFVFLLLFFNFAVLKKDFPFSSSENSSSVSVSVPASAPIVAQTQSIVPLPIIEQKNYENLIFFELACGMNKCSNMDMQLPPALLSVFIENKSVTVLYVDKKSDYFYTYYLESDQDFYNFLKSNQKRSDKQNEKGTDSLSFSSIVGGSK
ncbi:MAG: zonular occludens toxin domain-containing protein [Arcobacteraceae bacterium]|jgi:zona occludens toxin|nr:zonular occludens toxin domain-containing protein [Arcobacteraceae bacterium]